MRWIGPALTATQIAARAQAFLSNQLGRGMTEADWEAVHEREAAFRRTKPIEPCRACGTNRWEQAQNAARALFWVCGHCERLPMSEEQWAVEKAAIDAEARRQAEEAAAAGTPTATRAALKDAARRRDEAKAALARLEAAEAAAADRVYDASAAVRAAEEKISKARRVDVEALAAAVLAGGQAADADPVQAAQEALAKAEKEHASARDVRNVLAGHLDGARTSLKHAEVHVRTAAVNAVRAHSGKLLAAYVAETERMQAALATRVRIIQWLHQADIFERDITRLQWGDWFSGKPSSWPVHAAAGENPLPRWEAMIQKLCADSGAPAELK
jgi:hypothetical protein